MSNIINLLTSGYSVFQESRIHKSKLALEKDLFKAEQCINITQHEGSLENAKRSYLISIYADIESYYQELNENLISSTLDAERDMVDQRNQQFQTILIAATIILGTTIGVLFQAPFPQEAAYALVVVYATSIAASLLCLFVSIGLCVKVVSLVSRYMYKSSDRNIRYLFQARDETKKVMDNIRRGFADNTDYKSGGSPRIFSTADEETLAKRWQSHEKEVKQYFITRNDLNENYLNDKYERSANNNRQNLKRFGEFWDKHCRQHGQIATVAFYLGTMFMLISIATFMFSAFEKYFSSLIAGLISSCVIGVSMFISFMIVMYLKYFDPVITKKWKRRKKED